VVVTPHLSSRKVKMMYYVYILKSKKNNQLYIGFTNDLKRRFIEYNTGCSTATKNSLPWVLAYYEAYAAKVDAVKREKQFKRYAKAWGQLKGRIRNSILTA